MHPRLCSGLCSGRSSPFLLLQRDEAEILANREPSARYCSFLATLGNFVDLKDCEDCYTGGLDTSDNT